MTDLVTQRQKEKQLMSKAINLLFTEPINFAIIVSEYDLEIPQS